MRLLLGLGMISPEAMLGGGFSGHVFWDWPDRLVFLTPAPTEEVFGGLTRSSRLVHCFIDLRSSLMLSLQSVNKTLEIGFS